jgi:LmbE family N-acetylglucosaminyl deacetylase
MTHLHTVPDQEVTFTVNVSAVWERKLAAIRCHRTQMGSSPILDASKDRQRLFLGTEHFQLAATRLDPLSGSDVDFFKRLAKNGL